MHKLLVNRLLKPAKEKSVVKWTDRPAMTIAVDMGRKATKTNKQKLTFEIESWEFLRYRYSPDIMTIFSLSKTK